MNSLDRETERFTREAVDVVTRGDIAAIFFCVARLLAICRDGVDLEAPDLCWDLG
jgi:hypothetical protein